ncbi:MAG: hypothetical protein NZL96_00520 [Patescibacteria group bacterium]|nr:hypothetical protein [Patescibacteria group bacterium]
MRMVNKILIASHNLAKIKEIKKGLKPLEEKGVKTVTLEDFNIKTAPSETGTSFEENAFLKARFYAKKAGLATIADDGGLIIPYLNNEPGVKSRLWLGYPTTDEELINHTLKRLKNCSLPQRKAFLQTCVCFYLPKNLSPLNKELKLFQEERISGYIAFSSSSKRVAGYPFRALFIVEKFQKYYDELTEEEHEQVNHRLNAVKKLVWQIEEKLKI